MNRRFATLVVISALATGAGFGVRAWAATNEGATESCDKAGGGPHAWVIEAVDTLSLRPDQKAAVDQLKTDMKARGESMRATHKQIAEAVAASVEAGAIDHSRIDPLVAAATAGIAAHTASFEEAATRLHAILDQGQRQALVEALRVKMEARHGGHMFGHGGHGGHGKHLEKLAKEIGLTDAQIETIRSKIVALHGDHEGGREGHKAEMKAHHEHMKAMAEAFVSDSFDAHALGVGQNLSKGGGAMATKLLSHVEIALPLLTPAQRTLLAQKIREGHVEHAIGE